MSSQKSNKCPRLFISIFEKLVIDKEFETLIGDFEELYNRTEAKHGKIYAYCWFVLLMVRLIPSIIYNNSCWNTIMLKNYIKITYRNLLKHKGFSVINILGLAVGLTVCTLILLYVNHEISYDNFHKNADQIYRLCSKFKVVDTIRERPGVSSALPVG